MTFEWFGMLACSGPGARAAIAENVLLAQQYAMGCGSMMLLSVVVWAFARRFKIFPLIAGLLMGTHPYFLDNGLHGDCGMGVASMSKVWTVILGAVVLSQIVLWIRPPKARDEVRGFPVEVKE